MKRYYSILALFLALSAQGALVHVYEQTLAGGVTNQVADEVRQTGMPWTTQTAPAISGYIFTHWTISTVQDFASRDEWGRAYDAAPFMLYEDTTLTAHYLPVSQDGDGDGMADGYEIYWYGNLSVTSESDTDGDGWTFAQEVELGTNPLMADEDVEGPIRYADGELLQYNPLSYSPYVMRSEPEGVLFETVNDFIKPGLIVDSTTGNCTNDVFAYWTMNGVEQRDAWGRALDSITFQMPTNAVELVAYVISNAEDRASVYWYGTTGVDMSSDTDGDGLTFAQELALGTNPLMSDTDVDGPVRYADGELLQYNPYNSQPYVMRSEPEGVLFSTVSNYVRAGWIVNSEVCDSAGDVFAYWKMNGVEQRDEWGRALDSITLQMPTNAVEVVAYVVSNAADRASVYWYGTAGIDMSSDTDGDGFTFAQELANGTNPLMADEDIEGPVRYADGELLEVNLQPFEQVRGTILANEYASIFASPVAGAEGFDFGANAKPRIVDVDGDGRWDLVVMSDAGVRVLINVGAAGNPMFRETPASLVGEVASCDLAELDALAFDTPPVNPTSFTFADVDGDGVDDLLVADVDGRIWYYKHIGDSYVLQHKVWGGSYGGFANGLQIAAVDWDDDGDVDLVCGTAEGRLLLLNDPRIGRPVNLRAEAGATSVVLTWDPNVNSRVRGYGIYRSADSNNFAKVENMCPLPRYRDTPPTLEDQYYRVTGKSRFYVTGNSTPVETESIPTEAVFVQFHPSVWLNDTSSFTDTNVEVIVSMNNSMGLRAEGFSMTFEYDPAVLEPVQMKKTGLTSAMELGTASGSGSWSLTGTGGEIGVGAGEFLRLVFYVKPVHDVTETTVSLTEATVRSMQGQSVTLDLPKSAKIELSDSHPIAPAIVSLSLGDVAVDTGEEFELPVTVTSSEILTNGMFTVEYDTAALEWKGDSGSVVVPGRVVVATTTDFSLPFLAKEQHDISSTEVRIVAATVVDEHGFAVTPNTPVSGMVLIHDAHPLVPAVVSIATEDKKVDTLEEVVVPFKITSSETLTNGAFTVEWDTAALDFETATGTTATTVANGVATIAATGDFSLKFLAKDQHDISSTQIRLTAATVVDANAFTVNPSVPVVSTILIHDAHPLMPAVVSMTLSDVNAQTETEFDMTLSITSTEALTALKMTLAYDTSLLELRSGTLEYTGTVPSAVTLRFYAKENHTVDSTVVTVTPVSAADHNGFTTEIELPASVSGRVILADSNPWQPATVAVGVGSVKVDTQTEFTLPVTITSNEALTNFVATVSWDSAALKYRGANPLVFKGAVPAATNLLFYAKDQHDITSTDVTLSGMSAVDEHGLVANAIADATGTVLIHDAYPLIPAKVAVKAGDVSVKTKSAFSVPVAVTTTKPLTNLSFNVSFDASVLEYKGCVGAAWANGVVTASGTVPGTILLTFYAKDQHTVKQTAVTLSGGAAFCTEGLVASVRVSGGAVSLTDSNPPVAVKMAVSPLDARAESGQPFVVPLGATTDGNLSNLTVTVAWDANMLTFNGAEGGTVAPSATRPEATLAFAASGKNNLYDLAFTAKPIALLQTNTTVIVTAASGIGANGLAAQVTTALPVASTVIIVRSIGKYDPGDINGDGKYTDADMTLLKNYIKYLSIVSAAPQLASRYASWKLTGRALKAADVNSDGKWDVNDVSMLAQLIIAWEEANK